MKDVKRGFLLALFISIIIAFLISIPATVRYAQAKKELYTYKMQWNEKVALYVETVESVLEELSGAPVQEDSIGRLQASMLIAEQYTSDLETSPMREVVPDEYVSRSARALNARLSEYIDAIQKGTASEEDVAKIEQMIEFYNQYVAHYNQIIEQQFWQSLVR